MIERGDIEAAAERLAPILRETPLVFSPALSERVGRDVYLKPEHLQRTGSFKIRGAYNFISSLSESGDQRTVVAASAGNHAQGVALAANLCDLSSVIYMPLNASLPKVEATRGYGATVILGGESVDDCIALAKERALHEDAVFVPPFDDERIIAGQATIGLEIANDLDGPKTVIVPVGGGGLIAGVASALSTVGVAHQIVGVEPIGAASMRDALAYGKPVQLDVLSTMADGIAVRSVSDLTLKYANSYIDQIETVEEEQISQAVLLLLERHKWLVEPAGAVGLAALLAGKVQGEDPVVVLVSGGNIDALLLTRLIEHGLSAAGRYVMLRIVLSDKPGQLAALTEEVARMGLNVLSVDHHRSGVVVDLDEVEVLLTVETRDPRHRDEIVLALQRAGFRATPRGIAE